MLRRPPPPEADTDFSAPEHAPSEAQAHSARRAPWWHSPLVLVALPVLSVFIVALVLAHAAWGLRTQTLHAAAQQAQAIALLASHAISEALHSADQSVENAYLQSAAAPLPEPIQHWWVLDATGRILASADGTPLPPSAPSAQDVPAWAALSHTPQLVLLRPTRPHPQAPWSLLAAKAVHRPGQGLHTVRIVQLDPGLLVAQWQQIDIGALEVVSLFSLQGDLLARTPPAPHAMGQNFAGRPLFTQHLPRQAHGTFFTTSSIDQRDGLYAYHRLHDPEQGLVVVGQSVERVLSAWNQWAWMMGLLWSMLALGSVGAGATTLHQLRQRQRGVAKAHRQAHQLRELSHRILDAQEAERSRVARELHDELGQSLTAIKINLQAQMHFKGVDPAQWQADNLSMVEGALQQVRRLSQGLRPAILDNLGLTPALEWIGKEFGQRCGFTFCLEQSPHWPTLDSDTQTCLFRVAQEALTNIARHAQARQVHLQLLVERSTTLLMRVHDDGIGFHLEQQRQQHHSMGLRSMAERAALIGAQFHLHSTPGQGCTIELTLPYPTTDT